MRYDFSLSGLTPLLHHQDDVEAADELAAWRNDPASKNFSVRGDDRSPAWTWVTYLYNDGKHLAWPSYNLMVCLRQGASRIILKGSKTYKEISQSDISMEAEFLEFTVGGKQIPVAPIAALKARDKDLTFKDHADAVKAMGFRLWPKRAKIGQAKHVRVRARFDSWQMRGRLAVTAKEITSEVLEQIFEYAGRVGLGDWRPGCKTPGTFGMFAAALKLIREKAAA